MGKMMRTKETIQEAHRRYKGRNLKRLMVWSIQLEPGAPEFEHPEKYGIEREWTCFMDFYRNRHSGLFSDTYSAGSGISQPGFFHPSEGSDREEFRRATSRY
jgi:hypothetical protein